MSADPNAPANVTRAPSITTWTRLEPRTRSENLAPAVEARTSDAAWFLARQWQLGEFNGEDAGSPIRARVHAKTHDATLLSPTGGQGASLRGSPHVPLEALVEREPASSATDLRWAAELGQQFLRCLAKSGASALASQVVARYPVDAPSSPQAGLDPASALDAETLGYLRIVSGRIPHGGKLLQACKEGRFPAELDASPTLRPLLDLALHHWKEWLGLLPGSTWTSASALPLAHVAREGNFAWQRERLEYDVQFAAGGAQEQLWFHAPEYNGDRLDWFTFDGQGTVPVAEPEAERSLVRTVLPTPVAYRGMPATRFWEFEDARVNLAQISATASDLARLLVVQYGLAYANDHFVVPLTLPTGSVTRIQSLIVTDTFGVATLVPPAPGGTGWALFRPSGASLPYDVLLLPEGADTALVSTPVEKVRFARDELANLVWAIEQTVTSATGRAIDRNVQVRRAEVPPRPPIPDPPDVDPETGARLLVPELSYSLSTTIPEHWVPLVAVPTDDRPDVVSLRRIPLQQAHRDGVPIAVHGTSRVLDWRVLEDGQLIELRIPEEEVSRAGTRVTRHWHLARSSDGSVHLWLGRRKRTAGGSLSSGLRYDVVEPRPSR